MRAVAAAIDEMTPRQQRLDLLRREGVARFHGRFAGHHVEHFVQEFFVAEVERFLLAAIEHVGEEFRRVKTLEEAWKRMDGDGSRPDRGGFDSQALQERLNLFQQLLLFFAGRQGDWDQQPLAFQRAAGKARGGGLRT